ncbi:MAG: CPBP family intramembrane metalloprotease [Bacilli bacterium]|nr:CPBP family intramembrane metalloprotease [Bacilli bacterium]
MIDVKEKSKNIGKFLIILFLYFALSYVLAFAFQEAFNSKNNLINQTSSILASLFILLVLALFHIPKIINDSRNLTKDNLKLAYKNWLIGLIIMYISNTFILLINKDLAANETANRAILEQAPIYAILVMIVIAPITEEIIFRLSLKKIFKSKYTYCFFSGLIFGLMHLTSIKEILFIVPYGALGFFFAKTLYDTDNIFAPTITHITHNAMIIFILLASNFVGI